MYKRHLLLWIIFVDFSSALFKFHILSAFILETSIAWSRKQSSHGPCVLNNVSWSQFATSQIPCLKFIFKVLYLWRTIKIVFRKYKVFWIMLVDFNLTLLNLTEKSLPETNLQIQAATSTDVAICCFYGAPCTQYFRCSKSFLLGSICGEQSLSFLTLVFHYYSTQTSRIYFWQC